MPRTEEEKVGEKIKITVTQEMIDAVRQHEQEQRDRYAREHAARQRTAEEQFKAQMDAAYPGVDEDTRYQIYDDYREFYE